MDAKRLNLVLKEEFYDDKGDFHHIYYGQIKEIYTGEGLKLFPGV
jgi:hypothetical protein